MSYLIGIIVGFAIFVSIGIILSRKISSVEDYYVSSRNAPTLLITGSLIASFVSTVTFMGEAGFGYSGYPILQLIVVIFNVSGYVLGTFFFGRYLRRSKSLTVPEFFGRRFNSSKVQVAAGVTTIVGISAYIVAVTQGGALLFSAISGLSYPLSLLIIWVVYTSFTFLSGAKGVLVNDTLMFFIFLIATVVAIPFIIHFTGGWPDAIINTASLEVKPDILSWHGLTGSKATMGTPGEALAWAITLGIVWGMVVSVSPWQTSRYLMAKNEHVVIRSGILATISLFLIYLLIQIGMATVNLVNSDITPIDNVFIWSAIHIMPNWLGILSLLGIMAAVLSSCSTFLQLIGNSVSNDLFSKKSSNQKVVLRSSRIIMVLASIVIFFITLWQPPAVMWIGYFAATLFAASWGPIAFMSVYSKKINKDAAFWSIIFGFMGVIIASLLEEIGLSLPAYIDPAIIGGVLSLLAIFIFSKYGSRVTATEKEFQDHLFIKPPELFDPAEVKRTKKYPRILMYGGVGLIVMTFFIYYVPVYLM